MLFEESIIRRRLRGWNEGVTSIVRVSAPSISGGGRSNDDSDSGGSA